MRGSTEARTPPWFVRFIKNARMLSLGPRIATPSNNDSSCSVSEKNKSVHLHETRFPLDSTCQHTSHFFCRLHYNLYTSVLHQQQHAYLNTNTLYCTSTNMSALLSHKCTVLTTISIVIHFQI